MSEFRLSPEDEVTRLNALATDKRIALWIRDKLRNFRFGLVAKGTSQRSLVLRAFLSHDRLNSINRAIAQIESASGLGLTRPLRRIEILISAPTRRLQARALILKMMLSIASRG